MPVPLSTLAADCVLALNAGSPGSYSSSVTDPRWASAQIVDAILHADSLVCAAIFRNKNNARNQAFYVTQSGLASGDQIALNIVGAVASVVFVASGGIYTGNMPSVSWDLSEILNEVEFPFYKYDPHYFIDAGRRLWHNGIALAVWTLGTISVNVTMPVFFRTGACQSPDEYAHIVLAGAMSLLVPVEGENAGPQGAWGQQFEAGIRMISQGQGDMPQPDQMAAGQAQG